MRLLHPDRRFERTRVRRIGEIEIAALQQRQFGRLAIDAETETLIRKAMRFVMQGRTTFVIANRISTVKQADLVLVLENGRITQAGTHRQLMEQDGHYRYIAAVQLQPDTVTPPEPTRVH